MRGDEEETTDGRLRPEGDDGQAGRYGHRVTVDLILEKLGSGESIEAVLESHPRLTREGVLAALRFAAQALRAEVVYPVSAKSA